MKYKAVSDLKHTNCFDFISTTIRMKSLRAGRLETVVLVKQKGKWKIDVLHSTRIIKN
jgi:hypothetical protein